MSLLTLIIALVATGFILWAINKFVPMDAKVRQILNIAVILIVVGWILVQTGVLGPLDRIRLHC